MKKLALIPISDERQVAPAAMHELAAARYCGMNRTAFRDLVKTGVLPYAEHLNGKTRIYLRSDLDAYLVGLRWRKMTARESSPQPFPTGVAK